MEINNYFVDDQYPFTKISRIRACARAVLLDDQKRVCLTHLLADDKFGHRDYYELPGGGQKEGESPGDNVLREIGEEIGVKAEIIAYLGKVEDYYNLIEQKNISHYYLLKQIEVSSPHLEERESKLIDKIVWVDIDNAISLFEKQNAKGLAILLKRRELPILLKAKEMIDSLKLSE